MKWTYFPVPASSSSLLDSDLLEAVATGLVLEHRLATSSASSLSFSSSSVGQFLLILKRRQFWAFALGSPELRREKREQVMIIC
jgi:hypothetical protein